jgi:putative holliday junction resolvase
MGRLMAFDVGTKRVGIAVSDPLKIIANALDVLHPDQVNPFLQKYLQTEQVEAFIVGLPRQNDNSLSDSARFVQSFIKKLQKAFPSIPLHTYDERFTSVMAKQVLIQSGKGKKDRQNKSHIDKISATIILQDWMTQYQI